MLLLLGVIWAAVLVPPWVQARREARPTASIRSFHRQLWVLERTSPGRGAMGYRSAGDPRAGLRTAPTVAVYGGDDAHTSGGFAGEAAYGDVELADGYEYLYADDVGYGTDDDVDLVEAGGAAGVGGAGDAYAEDVYADDVYADDPGDSFDSFGGPGVPARRGALAGAGVGAGYVTAVSGLGEAWAGGPIVRRPHPVPPGMCHDDIGYVPAYQRRRRVLGVLLLSVVATLPPALLVGGPSWWVGQVAADVLLVGYLALLVRRRRRSVEREEKVRYLAPIRAPRPAVVVLHGGAAR
ncbi:MAG TPA: hypothetical protein VF743_04160 [Acidimicrobiales bacterium]